MHTKLLILDLDETLVFASEEKSARTEDFQVAPYFVYKRPGVERLIEFAFTHFEVGVWTSSSSNYAKEVINRIFEQPDRLQFVWARERCTRKSNPESGTSDWIKDLKKVRRLGRSLESVIVVDDSPRKLERSYGNHIRIAPFEGDPRDDDLRKLEAYLLWVKDVTNVRSLDNRNWRTAPVA